MNKKDHLILSFALGNDMCVLGIPTLLCMGATLNLSLGKLICSELNFTFLLLLDPPGKGLHDGVSLLASNHCVPPSISSNITSLVYYTAMDGFVHSIPNHATPSNDIMVHDSFCHGSVSRYLSFAPLYKNPVT